MRFGAAKAGVSLSRAWDVCAVLDVDDAAASCDKALALTTPTRARAEYDASMAARKAWETRKRKSG